MIAIAVLLEPDAVLLKRARATNAVLRSDHPAGFAFDDTHLPHVTLVQRYVRRTDLPAVCGAVRDVSMQHDIRAMRLCATGLHMRATDAVGSASWTLANTPALQALADVCLDAIAPFAVAQGGPSAFVPEDDGTPVRDSTVQYVERFVPDHSGANYAPHITLGRARAGFLRELQREPFEAFAFSPTALAVHQLGNHGTARRRLCRWPAG